MIAMHIRRRSLVGLLLLLTLPALLSASPSGQMRIGNRAAIMFALLDRYHVRAKADPYSVVDPQKVKRDFLNAVDSSGFYLMQSDVDRLMSIPLSVGDLMQGEIVFFDAAITTLRERMLQMQADPLLHNQVITEWPAWVEFHSDGPDYTKTPAARAERWKKLLRYRMLMQAYFEKPEGTLAEFEALLKAKGDSYLAITRKRELARIQRMLNHPDGYEQVLSSLFLNTIASQYDPHTTYFRVSDRKMMEEALSPRSMTYGFTLSRNMAGEIRIERLIPGGAADRSGKLAKQDVLLVAELAEPNGVRQVDLADLSLEDADQEISHPRSMSMVLTVRKADGSTQKVPLKKQKAASEQNTVTGFMLKGSHNVGYIYLPAFYTDWDKAGAPSFANDVAREILKLKHDGMQGLILDLRGNGGGSMQEAVNLAGLFVDSGPLMIERQRESRPRLVKDPSRGTVYDGPLMLLVNGQSVSASEFFTQMMRDYDRAVVVGSPTFGKATSQMIIPLTLDDNVLSHQETWNQLNLDSLKLTVNIYYGLNGRNHQRTGVIPDIALPDPVASSGKTGEAAYPYALEPDSIDKKVTFEKLPELPRSKLRKKSERRIAEGRFGRMKVISEKLEPVFAQVERVSLLPAEFFQQMKTNWANFDAMDSVLSEKSPDYSVVVDRSMIDVEKMDAYRKEVNDFQRERIEKDIYIEECFHVMDDWL